MLRVLTAHALSADGACSEYFLISICSTLTDTFRNLGKNSVVTENILCGDGKSGLPWEGNFIPTGFLWEFP